MAIRGLRRRNAELPISPTVSGNAVLVAVAADFISGASFGLWFDPLRRAAAGRSRDAMPFLVVDAETSTVIATLRTRAEADRWHDETIISLGWRPPPSRLALPMPADDEPLTRERTFRSSQAETAG
jgi:hypothetical protein